MAARNSTDSLGDLFVSVTGQSTLTEEQETDTRSGYELGTADIELMRDISITVRETGLEDALASPEVD
ncbi:hypothetical protein C453_04644 [Haloferax elongans ATCC BAA-1513]|uniref:Uncharacterized protein n=1 Tax=Haloferax elongans ATCC BAA-1513 TaxID=1230453 RepID=M0HV38_HALEO|nr:hypothetical protein [Haloferax elongans]ELZ87613.1 hypothetical protein C453_04644 [Haloferax elongans ATCC BAA-1513]